MRVKSVPSVVVALAMAWSSAAVGVQTVTTPLTLEADADWTGTGPVAIVPGGSIDLVGHQLKVDGLADFASTQIDVTSPQGTISSSTPIYSGSIAFLFDNNFTYSANANERANLSKNHRVCINGEFPFVVDYDFGEGHAKCLRSYKIYFNSVMPSNERAPKAWTFSGSDDGEAWTVLDTHTDYTAWNTACVRTFEFPNLTAYRHYRLSVSSVVNGSVLELYQLEYFETCTANCDVTVPGEDHVVSATEIYSGDAKILFDNNFSYTANANEKTDLSKNHRVCVNNKFPFRVVYDFGEGQAQRVNGYRMWYDSLGTGWDRGPKDWTFEGSNDNETWTLLDRRFSYTNWVRSVKCNREFAFVNTNAYRYCRLSVTAAGQGSVMELFQLEYFVRPAIWSTTGDLGAEDLTVPGGEDTPLSSKPYRGSVSHLFDNNFTYVYNGNDPSKDHRLLANTSSTTCDIVYDFGEGLAKTVNAYRIYYQSAAGNQSRHPTNWEFHGSDNGSVWTLLDVRTNEGNWPTPLPSSRDFAFNNDRPYRYYRLRLGSGQQYTEMYQLEFFRQAGTGELCLMVPQGTTSTNDNVAIDSGVKVVKDGAGTLVCAKAHQTYGGGTVVTAGTLKAALDGTESPFGINDPSIHNSGVTVEANGMFDLGGLGNWGPLPVTLAGGMLVARMPSAAPADTLHYVSLTDDSRLELGGVLSMDGEGRFDLGAHTLTAVYAANAVWTNRLPIAGGGKIAFEVPRETTSNGGRCLLAWEEVPSELTTFGKTASSACGVAAREDGVYTVLGGIVVIIR